MSKIAKELYLKLLDKTEFKRASALPKYTDFVNHLPLAVKDGGANKASRYLYENEEDKGILKRTIVLNTYNWLDSHGDVHLVGTFGKSISERGNKIPHLHDHLFQLDARVGKPIKFFEKEISWRELGASKTGMTTALFMESEVRRSYNEKVYEDYLHDEIDQHSVAMRYIKLELAINDPDDYPKEYAVWEKVIGLIGNRKAAEEQGFFWAVSEAALIEGSAVLLGSNELTPTLGGKAQPSKDTVEAEPLNNTRKEKNPKVLEELNKLSETLKKK